MNKIRPDAPIQKLIQGLESAGRQIRKLEVTPDGQDGIVKDVRPRANLREAGELSARLVESLAEEEDALEAQAGGLTEDRVKALLSEDD